MTLDVLVKPASKLDKMEMVNGVLHLKIRAKPVDGEANDYLVKYVSKALGLSKSAVSILKGHTSKHKTLLLEGDSSRIVEKLKQFEA